MKKTVLRETSPESNRRGWKIVLTALTAIALVLGYWFWIEIQKKPNAERRVERTISQVQFRDVNPVREVSYDEGCKVRATGWFGTTTICSVGSLRAYIAKGPIEQSLKAANDTLSGQGWKIDNYLPDQERIDQLKSTEDSVQVLYNRPDTPDLNLFYASSEIKPPVEIRQYLKDIPLAEDEHLFGIVVRTTY